jgi:hypothetical protein
VGRSRRIKAMVGIAGRVAIGLIVLLSMLVGLLTAFTRGSPAASGFITQGLLQGALEEQCSSFCSQRTLSLSNRSQPPSTSPSCTTNLKVSQGTPTTSRNSDAYSAVECPADQRIPFHRNYTQFVLNVFSALNKVCKGKRPLHWLFQDGDGWASYQQRYPAALGGGLALEFGVYLGQSLKITAETLNKVGFNGYIAGFDGFRGLPVDWVPGLGKGSFGPRKPSKHNRCSTPECIAATVRSKLPPNVGLEVGWFQETLPRVLEAYPNSTAAYIHLDGDLFVSAVIPLQLLRRRIVPGSILIFDELYHYEQYQEHEMLALYLWMGDAEVTLCALATGAPLFYDNATVRTHQWMQSAAFQVITIGHLT